ncbi:DNA alkylation repair protein [Leptospira alstonii]|uniref:DNA alkylation repair enzyme n=2 Tax=Leptospira alstonii TaxID=28452 RepID=M6DAI1_9LEPT|nr:DNA alkylation repair protein [Leptospira alstonii]EMJ95525.1 DNA alkylation repair enzyme [Leptospira alstonii serovar Sichuan str. 79601]EQA80097.1 DNA alkylation repair enzyme [Leptospira alstonii serovar Pingchang str. 80-412]
MDSIRSKKEIKSVLAYLWDFPEADESFPVSKIESDLLLKKVKFPLLEFVGKELYSKIPEKKQISFTDQIINLRHMGGYVIAAIILQLRLENHFEQSLEKAVDYIVLGNEWYVCDIIGERVMGYFLLKQPERTLPVLKIHLDHKNVWVARSVGVAAHYAVKKGLGKKYVEETFRLLLTKADTKDFHTKKGIGWAFKTVSKFHPDIIQKFEYHLNTNGSIQPFFKTKIEIGLSRSAKYASKYPD